jgi:hypothetical protein
MARYIARVRSPRPALEVFDLLADMRTYADWDPGTRSAVQVDGDGAGPGSVFDVRVAGVPTDVALRYVTEEYRRDPDGPSEALHVGRATFLTSHDRITVEPEGEGCLAVYDADVRLVGPLRLGDLGLRVVFGMIGRRAEAGLRDALRGVSVPA